MQAPEPQLLELSLDICGANVRVKSDDPKLLEWLRFDFSYFIISAPKTSLVEIEAHIVEPPWNIVPEAVESMRSPEYVCFDQGSVRYVNYFGRALVRFDYQTESALMYSTEPEFLYEKLYLLLLSRTGEALDRRGIHRVHSLGIAYGENAALFLMPSGGGKSTLALSLLSIPEVQLISEDTPLINSRAEVFPFPLRLGISQKQIPPDAPKDLVRVFHRDKWGTKYLLHSDYFKSKLTRSPVRLRYIFSGKWVNSTTPRMQRVSRLSMCVTLMRDCVFGLGLPQIVEYFLSTNTRDLFLKAGIALRRLYTVVQVAFKSTPYRIYLSKDFAANRELIVKFLRTGG